MYTNWDYNDVVRASRHAQMSAESLKLAEVTATAGEQTQRLSVMARLKTLAGLGGTRPPATLAARHKRSARAGTSA